MEKRLRLQPFFCWIAYSRRCRGRPCKKIENLFHCVFIFIFCNSFLNKKRCEGDCISLALPRASLQKNRKLASLRFLFCFLQFLLNASIQGFAENKNSEAKASLFFAERGGFEPPVPVTQYVSLANWWFQPLTHLSVLKSEHLLKAEMRVQRYMFFE